MLGVPGCIFVVGLATILRPWGEACSPPIGPVPPDTVQSRVHYANVVAYGRVTQHFAEFSPGNTYTAQMEIFCVFKGTQIPKALNVSYAGFAGGMCFSTKLDIGKSYVVFLTDNGESFRPSESDIEVTGVNDPYIQNVTRVCGLFTQYPVGVSEFTSAHICPLTDQTPNCVRHEPSPPVLPTEILAPAGNNDTTTTEAIPPLKEFPGPEVKADAPRGEGGLGSPENDSGAQSERLSLLMVFVMIASILVFVS